MSGKCRMMQSLKRNWLVVSKLTWKIWQILTRALESLKNFRFNGILLSKVYIGWAKKSKEELSCMTRTSDEKFGEKLTYYFKIYMRNLTIFDPSTRKSNFFYFNGLLLAKHILFELKKYRGVIFHDTEEWYKIWRGLDVLFQNWHEEFDRFWSDHSKV